MEFQYRLKTEKERLGEVELEIESLADLNETIDRLFEELERSGNASLLEELCPYFGQIWPSAKALAAVLSEERDLRGSRLLEVGCGLALPSLLAAKLGAAVVSTDFHPEVPKFLERNRRINSIDPAALRYIAVDWRKGEVPEELGLFDRVVGSDVLYERQHALELASVVSRFVSPQGRIIVTDPGRPYLQSFVDRMKELGFSVRTRIVREIFVLEFFARDASPR